MAKNRILAFFLVILALALLAYYYPQIQEKIGLTGHVSQNVYPKEIAVLDRVIDGDTIVVTGPVIGNQTHIRLLGINTPEKKMPFSSQAADFLKQFINQTIILERDNEDIDKYDRKLRYAYNEDETRFLDQEILEQGLANSYYTAGLKYEQQLLNAETQARNLEVGLWTKSNETCAIHDCLSLEELNYTGEFFILKNNCDYDCFIQGWFVKDAGRNVFKLGNFQPHEEKAYPSKNNTNIWNNDGDRFFMFDKSGYLVLFYQYSN